MTSPGHTVLVMVAEFPGGLTDAVTVVKLTAVVMAAMEYAHTLRAAMPQRIAAPIVIFKDFFILVITDCFLIFLAVEFCLLLFLARQLPFRHDRGNEIARIVVCPNRL
jgi:hypothetical protein